MVTKAKASRFFEFARERYSLLVKKRTGAPPPWTVDPVLQRYRFCNVFREDDKTTRWFRINVRDRIGNRPADQVRAAVIFRMINRIETGELIKDLLMPGAWDPREALHRMRGRVAEGRPIVGGAYMLKTPAGMDKSAGILKVVEAPVADAPRLAAAMREGRSLERAHALLQDYGYIGHFMAYEMVTDLRHTCVLAKAKDIHTWANTGPGAARGLIVVADISNRGGKVAAKAQLEAMRELLALSRDDRHWPERWPRWEMRDVEHTLCEYFKYVRAQGPGENLMRHYP